MLLPAASTFKGLVTGAPVGIQASQTETNVSNRNPVHGKRTSNAWKTKELRQILSVPPGPLAFDFERPFG